MSKRTKFKNIKTTFWKVIEVFDDDAPGLYELLEKDHYVGKINGTWADLMVYHGDDGGWCIDQGKNHPAHKRLENIRKAAGLPDAGEAFWLHIKTG